MSEAVQAGTKTVPPYTALASVYDLVMDHVDYEDWARYIQSLVFDFAGRCESVLELGCGTGSFALEFVTTRPCDYRATDGSADMIRVAREKAALFNKELVFEVSDFLSVDSDRGEDLVLLLYDGINYLLDTADVERLLRRVRKMLRPGGHFIFDQSTPANSLNNDVFFEDFGEYGKASYRRSSHFDAEAGLHHTSFDIKVEGISYGEYHVQRAYALTRMEECIDAAGLNVVGAFEDFSRRKASADSERIQWVLRSD